MKLSFVLTCLTLLPALSTAAADEYQLLPHDEAVPADAVSKEIAAQLSSTGYKVVKGSNRAVCQIWFCKQWTVKEKFVASPSILYPFEPGQMLGVISYPRDGEDFREQEIPKGVYVMRYALQPEDGDHLGTSDTRDFVLLLSASEDTEPKVVGNEDLIRLSTESIGGSHPAMLCLLSAQGEGDKLPALDHDEDRELWSVRVSNKSLAGDKEGTLALELVVVGAAEQ